MIFNSTKVLSFLNVPDLSRGITGLSAWLEVEYGLEGIAILSESSISDSIVYIASSQDPSVSGLQYSVTLAAGEPDKVHYINDTGEVDKLSQFLDIEIEFNETAAICRTPVPGTTYKLSMVYFGKKEALESVPYQLIGGLLAVSLRNSLLLSPRKEQTNRIRLDRILEESQQLQIEPYRELFENSSDGVFILDSKYNLVFINKSAEAITGFSLQSLSGRNIIEIASKESHHFFSAGDSIPTQFEMEILTTSNELICLGVNRSNLLSDKGFTVLVCRDVTETKFVEERLRETYDFLVNLIDNSVVAIVSMAVQDRINLFNPAAELLFGYSRQDVVGKIGVVDLFEDPEHWFMVIRKLSDFSEPESIKHFRTQMLDSKGYNIPVSLSAFMVPGFESNPPSIVLFITDMRKQMELEKRITEYQFRLAEQEKQAMITELAGALAHELNQPLMSILGYSQLLSKPELPREKFERAVNHIGSEAERMAEIVKRIGNITKFETRKYVGHAKIVDLDKSSDSK